MKTIISSLALLLSLVAVQRSHANLISGYVKSSETNVPLSGVSIKVKGKPDLAHTDQNGYYTIKAASGDHLTFTLAGYQPVSRKVRNSKIINVVLVPENKVLEEVAKIGGDRANQSVMLTRNAVNASPSIMIRGVNRYQEYRNSESYKGITENRFINPLKEALSTFAADVDAASYSNVRRFINQGQLPPTDAVRIEEMINYFQYDLKAPTNGEPVTIMTELTLAPWNTQHQLLRISLKAKDIAVDKLPTSNFVFLIDVSGSMYSPNKLPLVKSSLKMLVDQLRDNDKVSIVTYAGNASVKLASTSGSQKMKIKDAIDALEAGGSTAGGAGIKRAYQIARENFIKGGNNRIIMATDGDFNVGASSDEDMEKLIAKERESGIHISLLGYGMGNYKDSKMEILAQKGHGNYAYIDNISEARKAIITEFGGTLFTVAKDVKIQVEFNPYHVQAYRLVGYENRLLEAEDFNNDQKLGGDMGVGHSVTALYEIIPAGIKSDFAGAVDDLKYQEDRRAVLKSPNSTELATVKFRYKEPESEKSKITEKVVLPHALQMEKVSEDLRFASAVAELGLLIRNSEYKQKADFDRLIQRAKEAKGRDEEGYRAEFIRLAEDAKALIKSQG